MNTRTYELDDHEQDVIFTVMRTLASAGNLGSRIKAFNAEEANAVHTLVDKFRLGIQGQAELFEVSAPKSAYLSKIFTDEDRQKIWAAVYDQVNDLSPSELAEVLIGDEDLVSCIGHVADDADELARLLEHLDPDNDPMSHLNGEFLRAHDDDGDGHAAMLDFAKRFGLINDEETELTERGKEFVSQFS